MTTRRVVIFGVGDAARGDDGLGPALIRRLREADYDDSWWLTLVDDTQLRIEHALDLQINDLALFVDASDSAKPPFEFRAVETPTRHRVMPMSQALQPEDVVHTLSTIARHVKTPASFVLELPATEFGLSNSLSASAGENLDAAVTLVESLLDNPNEEFWRSKLEA